MSVGFLFFFSNYAFSLTVLYSRNLISQHQINPNTGNPFISSDVLTITLSTGFAIMSFDILAPNINIINKEASSNYFSLFEKEVKIDLRN